MLLSACVCTDYGGEQTRRGDKQIWKSIFFNEVVLTVILSGGLGKQWMKEKSLISLLLKHMDR